MNPQLIEYIKASLAGGQSRENITQALVQNGWKSEDVAQGFAQLVSPAPVYSAPVPVMASSSPAHSKLPWILGTVAVVAILAVGGGLVWASQQAKNTGTNAGSVSATASSSPTDDVSGGNGVADTPTDAFVVTVGSSAPAATTTSPTPASTVCNNYDCLIAAAKQCQQISGVISYSMPNPLLGDMFINSGQTKYEINKSSGGNSCTLTVSYLSATISASVSGRNAMADQGLTDAQISAQLQKMNNSQKSIIGVKTTCPGSTTAISSYLADMKNSTVNAKSGGSVSSSYSTTIYTTSSGKDLVCTTPNPA